MMNNIKERFNFIKGFHKEKSIPFLCPLCNKDSLIFSESGWFSHDQSAQYHSEDWFDPEEHSKPIYNGFIKCSKPDCNQHIACCGYQKTTEHNYEDYDGYHRYYSTTYIPVAFYPTLNFIYISPLVPPNVSHALKLSFSLVLTSCSASGNALRSSIEHLLDEYIERKKNESLDSRIKSIENHPILGKIQPYLMAIKWLGNHGSHDIEKLKYIDIAEAYGFMEDVLNTLYQESKEDLSVKVNLININKGPLSMEDRLGIEIN